jgi:hypothetical protein
VSVQAFGWVLDHSEAQGLERLVLQSHANNARGHEPPWLSWTGIDTVVHETRATRRGVQKATQRLVEAKRLRPTGERRGAGTLVYEIAVNADRDRVDREARLKRQEEERTRSRRGANRVRPSDSTDESSDVGELGSPPEGEQSSPPRGEQNSPPGANFETPGGELEDASAEHSSPKPSVTDEPAAANAAAAGEPAGSGSSNERWDVADEFFSRAADVLLTADFTAEAISADRLKIRTELRKHADRLPQLDWRALAEQLKAGRADGSIVSPTPIGVLAFGLRQRVPTGRPPAPNSSTSSVRDGLEIPEPDEKAAVAWRQLVDGLRETPQWPEVEQSFGQALPLVQPLTLNAGVLRITGTQHAMYMLERDAIPVLDAYARQYLNGRVVLVARDEAARG